MSNELKDPSGMPNQQASGDGQEIQQEQVNSSSGRKDYVKYESYQKAVGEKKSTQRKLDETLQELTELRTQRLEDEGKKDEVIEELKTQLSAEKSQRHQMASTIARDKVFGVISKKADELGCTSHSLLRSVVESELVAIDFDDELNPNQDQVTALLEKIKSEEPILFSKTAPSVATHNLNNKMPESSGKSLNSMSKEELMAALEKAEGKMF